MADEKLELGPNEVALVRAADFIDPEGDAVAIVIIGGVTYARLEDSLEEAIDTTRRTIETLVRFQSSTTVRHVELGKPPARDPGKEN